MVLAVPEITTNSEAKGTPDDCRSFALTCAGYHRHPGPKCVTIKTVVVRVPLVDAQGGGV